MAQHDYNIANATGANFRADLNNAMQAIVTQNSGSTLPVPTFPGMLWLDLSGGGDGVMRRRNQANTAWLTDLGIDQTARDAAAAAQATANAAMPRAGGTFTGAVNLIPGEPVGNNAMSRAAADALYQVRLPVASAGALLIGAAGGWTATMPVGSAGAALVISGGLPIWQSTATVAAPGSIVRTLSDGTIDPSFIPAVASGLRFRGTFKPAVNAEYPTTGGSGAAGAPAVGDFWVIDGLTTGGFTYLTGPLAGVTVHNGDSIAYNGTGQWFRMGNVVNVEGYLKTDGSNAMAAALNMGAFPINNVNGIAGVVGTPVPLTNFKIDGTNIVISPQRGASGTDLAPMQAGQLGTDIGRMQIYVGTGGGNIALLPVRFHSTTAAYATNDYATAAGRLWRAASTVAAGAFVPSQWRQVMDSSGGTLIDGALQIYTRDALKWRGPADQGRFYIDHTDTALAICTANDDGSFQKVGLSIQRPSGMCGINDLTVYESFLSQHAIQVWGQGPSASMTFLPPNGGGVLFYIAHSSTGWSVSTTKTDGSFAATILNVRRGTDGNPNAGIDIKGRLVMSGVDNNDDKGTIYFGGSQARYLDGSAGGFWFSGADVYGPAFHPTCDARIKAGIAPVVARALAPGLYEYTRDGHDEPERGPVAQRVQEVAPDYVTAHDTPEGERLAVNLMGLTYEMVCNLADRVRALEEAATIH